MYFMGELALRSGTLTTGFTFDWAWSNFPDSLSGHTEQIVRSFFYAGTATLLALLIAYPLAYAIAFRAGRFKTAAAVRGDRALLHHLPDPHDRLENDPQRLRARSSASCRRSRWCRRTAASSPPRGR